MINTMKLNDFIVLLLGYKQSLGNVPVIHQSDPEGNECGTIAPMSVGYLDTKIGPCLFICPCEEHIEEELFVRTEENQNEN